MRVIAVVDIPFSEVQWVSFKKEVLELKHKVTEKEDSQGYKFEQVNGKLFFVVFPSCSLHLMCLRMISRKR